MENRIYTDYEAVTVNTNKVYLIGELVYDFKKSHKNDEEQFVKSVLKVRRNSGAFDFIPLVAFAKDSDAAKAGDTVEVHGAVMTHYEPGRCKKVMMYTMISYIRKVADNTLHENIVILAGVMSRYVDPIYRITPFGRKICDFTIQRPHRRKDYTYNIYAIAWGKNASFIASLERGSKIAVKARFQSRVYYKSVDGDESNKVPIRTYEISVVSMLPIEL